MSKNTKIFGLVVISALFFIMQASSVSASACAGKEMTLDQYKAFKANGKTSATISVNEENGKAVAHLRNDTDCLMPVGLDTYKMYDNILSNQTLFDRAFMVVPAHTTEPVKLKANIPDCMAQIDAYLGHGWTEPNNLIAWFINQSTGTGLADAAGNFCKKTTPLVVSCFATPSTVDQGKEILWTANATGGNGTYTYSWSGDGGIAGSGKTKSKTYYTPGTKNASVTVTSGDKTKTANCSVNVVAPLVVSCVANPSTINVGGTINWTATATGGTGSYVYIWSNPGQFNGNPFPKTYTTAGAKTATVSVTSGNQTKTASCSGTVVTTPITLTVSCSASPSTVNKNETIIWSASASGGNSIYTYSWSGTDGLSGNGQSVNKNYPYTGTKNALVTVTSNNVTRTASCSATVTEDVIPLTVSCSPSSSSVKKYTGVYWNAYVSGGNGGYSYSWSGTDGLYGSGSSVYKNYSNTGSKTANVNVTSNGQSVSASCYLDVYDDYNPTYLEGSCSASPYNSQVGTNVSWNASAYGGNGNYYYSWSGTDGLYGNGQYISKSYYAPGYKTATVTISSNGQSITRTCNTNVSQVLAYTQTNDLPTLTSVYLSEVPYTGIEDNFQLLAFLLGLIGFSALLAYLFIRRKTQEVSFEQIAISSVATGDAMTDKFVCDRIVSDKQVFESVEDVAMNNKAIMSLGAIESIVKASRINCLDEREMTQKAIDSCRKDRSLNGDEWCVIGEEDIKKVI